MFADEHRELAAAARNSGGVVIGWDDDWWTNGAWPKITGPAVFHGSLGNADRIVRELPWQPGAFCATPRFACSAWWETVREELVAERFVFTTVAGLVAEGPPAGFGDQVFVRPDSPPNRSVDGSWAGTGSPSRLWITGSTMTTRTCRSS